jgi:hypothetical protein
MALAPGFLAAARDAARRAALRCRPEVILSAGEILFLPADYIHFIVSLGVTIQCNTRGGVPPERPDFHACGF